ncbi:DUF5990 family protein [Streptomyces sp. NBC_01622]|uniref:DUF5990 family protein n=1 Tax=Streptomyces sp. NBC_01622 TaxID=2975903 RepID=UPI00386B1B02
MTVALRIRINAVDLPGLTCPSRAFADDDVLEYRNIHVAVQRRDRAFELLDLQPGDAAPRTSTGVSSRRRPAYAQQVGHDLHL